MIKKMPVILVLEIALLLFLTPYLSLGVQQALYATSLTIKSIIVFILPMLIFGLLFKTMVGLARRATATIALIFLCVILSNTLTTFISHYAGAAIYNFDMSLIIPSEVGGLSPAWVLTLPKWIANDKAMFLGVMLGIIAGFTLPQLSGNIANVLDKLIGKIFTNFLYVIPLFIAGFVVKLQHDGVMGTIFKDYSIVFMIIALTQLSYILFVYSALNRFNLQKAFQSIRHMIPAAITGFSTMSSAAAMPVTIEAVRNNTKNKDLASSVVPVTVNIHLIGDCIAIPVFAYAVMKSFGVPVPTLIEYMSFLMYFVLAKFSVAAIPGGGIIVMLPILESCLGFNGDMLSLMTALYILFDPIITCSNVLGNGAFAILIDKIMQCREPNIAVLDNEVA